MITKNHVIILNTISYKENNLIIKTLSKQDGIKTFFLSRPTGKSKRKDRNNYQVFSMLELVSKTNSKSNLPKITESKNLHLLLNLRTDVGKNAVAFLLAETLSKCVQEEESNPPLFDFISSKIITLDTCSNSYANFHLHFIAQLTKYLGICPNPNEHNNFFDIKEGEFCKNLPHHSNHLKIEETKLFLRFLFEPWSDVQDIKLSGSKRSYLLGEILKYYQYHVPGFEQPKSLDILNEVFRS
jgi:DNA repair protein RecO (recombination protein O)